MPEDPAVLADALAEHDLTLIGGVVFRPFHDVTKWDEVWDAATRTCTALVAHGTQHLVLIDSISDRIRKVAELGVDHGLTVGIHAHVAGFMGFEPELERLLAETDETLLKICIDTGHHSDADFDPIAFMTHHIARISYMHFSDIDPVVKARAVAGRTGFYDASGQGIFCNLGQGDVDFPAVRQLLLEAGFQGWCTVEQDCDPGGTTSPVADARANRGYLSSIGF